MVWNWNSIAARQRLECANLLALSRRGAVPARLVLVVKSGDKSPQSKRCRALLNQVRYKRACGVWSSIEETVAALVDSNLSPGFGL